MSFLLSRVGWYFGTISNEESPPRAAYGLQRYDVLRVGVSCSFRSHDVGDHAGATCSCKLHDNHDADRAAYSSQWYDHNHTRAAYGFGSCDFHLAHANVRAAYGSEQYDYGDLQ